MNHIAATRIIGKLLPAVLLLSLAFSSYLPHLPAPSPAESPGSAQVGRRRSGGVAGGADIPLGPGYLAPRGVSWMPPNRAGGEKVEAALRQALARAPGAPVEFLVYLKQQADLSGAYAITDRTARGQYVYDRLWQTAQESQAGLLGYLDAQAQAGAASGYRSFYIVNAVLVTASESVLLAVAARPDVAYVELNETFPAPAIPGGEGGVAGIEWGVLQIGADQVWADFGTRGEGAVVANIDTGVMSAHAALVNQYRGTATGSHDYNWFDPTGTYPDAPGDNNGLGTHTMGTMIGDDGGGNQIGVAPGAQWIAVKGCAEYWCTEADLLAAAEWVLAPFPLGGMPADGDPAMRPDAVHNSWGGRGGDLWFLGAVVAWRAADIFPAFVAGASGPEPGSIGSPGDYPESFASGATDINDEVASFSSRGPSSLTDEIKPDVTAPGVNVRSSLNDGGYAIYSGSSMASAHTTGCVALLRSLNPTLTVTELEDLLTATAVDLGEPGPDYDYGYGRIDCLAAAALAAPLVADDTAYGVTYDGWTGVEDPLAFGGGYRASAGFGQRISVRTNQVTDALSLITYRGPDQGQALILIDGVSKGVLDLYAPTPQYQVLAMYGGLPSGPHQIVVLVLGRKNPLSSGAEVRVDGFRAGAAAIDENSPTVGYTAWRGRVISHAYGGGLRSAAREKASIAFSVNGPQFTWISARGPVMGQAAVIVDGVPAATVDLYNPSWQLRYEEVLGGLGPGAHSVRIEVLGTHGGGSSGNNVVFDGFSVP